MYADLGSLSFGQRSDTHISTHILNDNQIEYAQVMYKNKLPEQGKLQSASMDQHHAGMCKCIVPP